MHVQRFITAELLPEKDRYDAIRKSFETANACLPTHWNGKEVDLKQIRVGQEMEIERLKYKAVNRARYKCHLFIKSMLLDDPEYQVTFSFHFNVRQDFSSATST